MSEQLTTKDFFGKTSVKQKFEELLGKRAPAFMTSVLQIVASNELLKRADPTSVYHAAATAATLDLPLSNNLGFAYLVPYNDRKSGRQLAQFLIGYKGFKQLAIRSGQYQTLDAKIVYEGQKIDDDSFQGFHFEWDKKVSDKVIGYASNFKLLNGYESTFFMDADTVHRHGKRYSQTFKNGKGLWAEDFDKMALKTVTKLHLNSGDAPLSVEMQKAVMTDQSVIHNVEGTEVEYIDNQADNADPEETSKEKELQRIANFISNAITLEQLELVDEHVYDFGLVEMYESRKQELYRKSA